MNEEAGERRARSSYAYFGLELLVLSQLVLMHVILAWMGTSLGLITLRNSLMIFFPSAVISVAAAVAVRAAVAHFRGKAREFVGTIRRPAWIIQTVRLILAVAVTYHVYFWVKLLVPLIHPVSYDRFLWDLDAQLFFGHSPNEVFLMAAAIPPLVRVFDWIYANGFFLTISIAMPFFISSLSVERRFRFVLGNSILWLTGGWLYVLIPSMGPAYEFSEVWGKSFRLFNESRYWQYQLLQNYVRVADIPQAGVVKEINFMYGIGAFPSLHVGFQSYVAFWVSHLFPRLRPVMFAIVATMFFASVLTGWHYMIDSVAGLILGYVCYRIFRQTVIGEGEGRVVIQETGQVTE